MSMWIIDRAATRPMISATMQHSQLNICSRARAIGPANPEF